MLSGLLVVLTFIILQISPVTVLKSIWQFITAQINKKRTDLNGDQPLYPKEKKVIEPVTITEDDLPPPLEEHVPIVAS